jgi:hypothetical protein
MNNTRLAMLLVESNPWSRAGDRRARGLRLYVAWSCKEKEPMNFRTVVPLQPSSGIGEQVNRNAA